MTDHVGPAPQGGLDPQIATLLPQLDSGFPPVHTMTGAEARAAIRSRFRPASRPRPVASITDTTVTGPDGPVPVRIYHPRHQDGPLRQNKPMPTLVYAHGGGWVFCDLDSHDELCRDLADRIPAVVVSEHVAELGGRADAILVGGDSAGGNLAAVTALMARDRSGPRLAGQLLLYPVIAADFDTESYRRFGTGYYNPRPALRWYWDQYVPDPADRDHPYACPLRAELNGLPPAIMAVAGHDPLRDEGLAYGAALQQAGVSTVVRVFDGGIHGFMTMPALHICDRARSQVCADVADLVGRIGVAAP